MQKKFLILPIFLAVLMSTSSIATAFAAKPIVKQVTGGGWILDECLGEAKKTFGFNAEQLADGTLRGNVEYVDHETGYPHVHGYDITALTISGNEATIYGTCRLNGDNTPRSFTVFVRDVNEPGKHDFFHIDIPSIGYWGYWAEAELGFPLEAGGGGNIQIHVPPI